jgi:CRP/FNR family transcriptional regulator
MPHSEHFDSWIRTFPALGAMDATHLEMARSAAHYPLLAEGEVAYRQGWACPNYVMCVSGRTRVFKSSPLGREILIYRVETGGTCVLTTQCLLSGGDFPAESVAEAPTRLVALPAASFRELMARSEPFRRFVLDDYGRLLASMFALVDEVAFSPLDQRLARRLIALADGDGRVAATHQQLAQDLGTVREVVSRHLGEWERAGHIRTARGVIHVLDRQRLAAYRSAGRD